MPDSMKKGEIRIKSSRLSVFAALAAFAALGALALSGTMPAAAQAPTPADHVAALKANLAMSQKLIRQYEWTETTAMSLKGEVALVKSYVPPDPARIQAAKAAKDKVGLAVRFGSLTDGATYAEEITLSAPSQKIEVTITNSGYKKL